MKQKRVREVEQDTSSIISSSSSGRSITGKGKGMDGSAWTATVKEVEIDLKEEEAARTMTGIAIGAVTAVIVDRNTNVVLAGGAGFQNTKASLFETIVEKSTGVIAGNINPYIRSILLK